MVLNARAEQIEHVSSQVIAVGNVYPDGHFHPMHRHRRSQVLYAEYGVMLVRTETEAWLVPPQAAVWIPSGVAHGIHMLAEVATRSVYLDRDAAAGFPETCVVVNVSPLLRTLLIEAASLPADYPPDSRAAKLMALIVEEARQAPVLPSCVPMPRAANLADACRRFAQALSISTPIDRWCEQLGMSRRSFTRRFRHETGLSFAEWRRHVCVQEGMARLAKGQSVTNIAFDLGYSDVSAFTAMFTRTIGQSPRRFMRR